MKKKYSPQLKLKIEMVPQSSWGISLRNCIPRSRWDKLRKEVHQKNGMKCEICGSSEKLNCHEHWEFDETTNTQKLTGLGTLCNMCHHVAHFGRSEQIAAEGHLDIQAVINHFLKVNNCTPHVFSKHEGEALAIFLERSRIHWKVDFGSFSELIPKDAS